ncbi:hypothetical protein [Ensifer canadensis]|uniref:hypothetical protein n=1 Tax=Ensifer canadensis TaxID=555315 RepID=UPI0035E3CF1C
MKHSNDPVAFKVKSWPDIVLDCQHKGLLPIALAASEEVLSGKAQPQAGLDLWDRHYNKYEFGRISILSK